MRALMEGRTVFVIIHRLSTVRNDDANIMLEHGEIILRGYQGKLLGHKSRYYQMHTGITELD